MQLGLLHSNIKKLQFSQNAPARIVSSRSRLTASKILKKCTSYLSGKKNSKFFYSQSNLGLSVATSKINLISYLIFQRDILAADLFTFFLFLL